MPATAVRLRRLLARRPWIYWTVIVLVAVGLGARVHAHTAEVDAARDAWGATAEVFVASTDIAPGEPIVAERQELPVAMLPEQPVDDVTGAVARQHVSAGEVLTSIDVAASGPLALVPADWLAVPVVEVPTSGAAIGDRVQVAVDGIVVSADGLVVGQLTDATLVAMPAAEAPMTSAADRVTLLLVP